ncbi:uncharacterized protein LOC116246082 isoform X2 [Nymphaea colorata]|uniref:uncharacterized protein LOC116246082 isoform X2 n=1 Tax=Nymphaea colorata TaxID=210225 RepID=UPI00129E3653|nr:uncharacterized protein LOC116246082 isoform X2 [Nymphaea colorata]
MRLSWTLDSLLHPPLPPLPSPAAPFTTRRATATTTMASTDTTSSSSSLSATQSGVRVQIYPTSNTGVITPFWRDKYEREARKYWDIFYRRHENRFFKDRHYLDKEWGRYFDDGDENDSKGSTSDNKGKKKIVFEGHKDFKADCVDVFVCDLTVDDLGNKILPSSVDVVTMIFMLSAVSPEKMPLVLQNIRRVLKPSGYVLLRDYAIGDLAQERLTSKDQKISENFYVRGDGTRAFYFSEDFLLGLLKQNGFICKEFIIHCKQVENRSRGIVMDRRWMQCVFCTTDGSNSHESCNHVNCIPEFNDSEKHHQSSETAVLANDVDISDSILVDMFNTSTNFSEKINIAIGDHIFNIKMLSKEFQHTCKSTGLMLWESARLMSSILADNPSIVTGKSILELGCGSSGICSMIAAGAAKLVVATDGDERALDLLGQNIISNVSPPLSDRMAWKKLEWGNSDDIGSVKELCPQGFDVIIGTDVTYIPDAILPLFKTASALISGGSTGECKPVLILCHVLRRVDEASILDAASQAGFTLVDSWPFETGRETSQQLRIASKGRGLIAGWLLGDVVQRESHSSALNIMCFEFSRLEQLCLTDGCAIDCPH